MKRQVKIALLSSLLLGGMVLGSPATLFLDEGAGVNSIQIDADIDGILFDSATTTYTGMIEVDLEIVSGEVSAFEMTGGLVSASNISFYFELFPGTGQTLDFLGATATPISPLGQEVLATAGSFSAPQHVFRFDDGCIESDGAFGFSKGQVSDDPFDAAGTGNGTVTLGVPTPLNSTLTGAAIAQEYPVNLSLLLDSTVVDDVEGVEVTTVTTGTVTAQGMVLDYVHPFYEWAAENAPEAGLALAFDTDANGDGVCDGMAWALGLEAGARSQVPAVHWDEVNEEFVFSFVVETRHPIVIEASDDLTAGGWFPVAGFDPIAVGTTGEVAVPSTGIASRFFRLVSDL